MDFIRFLAFSLICGFLILGCGKQQTSTNGQSEPKRVTTVTAEALTVENRERVPGNVHPATNSTIEAKLSGRIVKFLAKEGDKVREGDVLVELDGHEIRARLDQALASEKQATLDLARFKKLLPAGAVTQQEYDAAEARAKVAAASVAEARAFVGYVKIVAPYDGIITKTIFEEGDLASPGKPLLTMEKQDLYRFEADVPETLASSVRVGNTFDVSLSGLEDRVAATVMEVSPTTDPNSRTLHIKLNLPSNPVIRTGQFGYVLIPVQQRAEIRIPLDALVERGQIEAVMVIDEGVALLRLVRTGKRNGNSVEILSGLEGGEVIVSENPQDLVDGDKVEVQE